MKLLPRGRFSFYNLKQMWQRRRRARYILRWKHSSPLKQLFQSLHLTLQLGQPSNTTGNLIDPLYLILNVSLDRNYFLFLRYGIPLLFQAAVYKIRNELFSRKHWRWRGRRLAYDFYWHQTWRSYFTSEIHEWNKGYLNEYIVYIFTLV